MAAASLLHALLKATDHRLAGCFPNANPGLAAGAAPVQSHLFIVGDFLVIDVQRTSLRFDERLMLKEDYDYTAQHLHEHGGRVSLEPHFMFVRALRQPGWRGRCQE